MLAQIGLAVATGCLAITLAMGPVAHRVHTALAAIETQAGR